MAEKYPAVIKEWYIQLPCWDNKEDLELFNNKEFCISKLLSKPLMSICTVVV